ncbi:MAG TPA: pilin [bacterium]|nr:pilin [bacterium]HPL95571.1 pilin [bacterium]
MLKKFLFIFILSLFSIFFVTSFTLAADPSCLCDCRVSPSSGSDYFITTNQAECQTQCCGSNPTGCTATCTNLPSSDECGANPALVGCCANPLPGQKDVDPNMAGCPVDPNAPANPTTNQSSLNNPIAAGSIEQIIGRIIKAFLGIIGSISLLIFVYGGFILLTSQGNSAKIKTGQDTLVYASIGILIVFASYALLNFVFNVFN